MIHEHLHLLKSTFESTLRLTSNVKKKNGSNKKWFQSINIFSVTFCERLFDPKFLDFYHLCDTDLPTS